MVIGITDTFCPLFKIRLLFKLWLDFERHTKNHNDLQVRTWAASKETEPCRVRLPPRTRSFPRDMPTTFSTKPSSLRETLQKSLLKTVVLSRTWRKTLQGCQPVSCYRQTLARSVSFIACTQISLRSSATFCPIQQWFSTFGAVCPVDNFFHQIGPANAVCFYHWIGAFMVNTCILVIS